MFSNRNSASSRFVAKKSCLSAASNSLSPQLDAALRRALRASTAMGRRSSTHTHTHLVPALRRYTVLAAALPLLPICLRWMPFTAAEILSYGCRHEPASGNGARTASPRRTSPAPTLTHTPEQPGARPPHTPPYPRLLPRPALSPPTAALEPSRDSLSPQAQAPLCLLSASHSLRTFLIPRIPGDLSCGLSCGLRRVITTRCNHRVIFTEKCLQHLLKKCNVLMQQCAQNVLTSDPGNLYC